MADLTEAAEDTRKSREADRPRDREGWAQLEKAVLGDKACNPGGTQKLERQAASESEAAAKCDRAWLRFAAALQDEIDRGVSASMLLSIREVLSESKQDCEDFKADAVETRRLLAVSKSYCAPGRAR